MQTKLFSINGIKFTHIIDLQPFSYLHLITPQCRLALIGRVGVNYYHHEISNLS
jgi:hypothetical protein